VPPELTSAGATRLADSDANLALVALSSPRLALRVDGALSDLVARVSRIERVLRPDAVLLHYSLLPVYMRLALNEPDLFRARPHIVLYFAPALPNSSVPWPFDSRLSLPDFALYSHRSATAVRESWDNILVRLATPPAEMIARLALNLGSRRLAEMASLAAAQRALLSMRHALCWSHAVVPHPTITIAPWLAHATRHVGMGPYAASNKHVTVTGVPSRVGAFLRRARAQSRRVCFVTFGSFGSDPRLRAVVPHIVAALCAGRRPQQQQQRRRRWAILLHGLRLDDDDDDDDMLQTTEYVPYEGVVPACDLVAFTGSLCLQLTCLRHSTPMLFVPLLMEQFFWAKNYEYQTGVRYVDAVDDATARTIAATRVTPRAREFLDHASALLRSGGAKSDKSEAALSAYVRECCVKMKCV